jgi:hypothetical protein
VLANGEIAEYLAEIGRARHLVVIFQHRQEQALAKASGPQKKQVPTAFFEESNILGSILIEIASGDNAAKIGYTIGEFHAANSIGCGLDAESGPKCSAMFFSYIGLA